MDIDQDSPVHKRIKSTTGTDGEADALALSDSIFVFRNRTIGLHDNVFEGEMRSAVYDVRPCVIKFSAVCEQIVKEAEILTQLGSHTNVIAIIQSGTYCDLFEDHVYIALDKCHHENLQQYLANRKVAGIEFDLNQAIDFAKQMIVGVMYIHDNNVIHLDLKPSNILISQNLRLIKLADFGLSIIVKSSNSKVFHKGQFGTNGYRPMESFGNGEVSRRTDIFSLGTVLLHLLSNGNDVFGRDEHTFIHNVINDITNTSGLLVDNPATTEHLIKCMVSKNRCRRPNIREVSDHPCWTGKETKCDFDYFCDDEEYDTVTDEMDSPFTERIMPLADSHSQTVAFLKKMRVMGFNRKPVIAVFDDETRHLHQYNHRNRSMTKMQSYPHDKSIWRSSVVSLGEYIYVLNNDGSVYQLEYGDGAATWKRMSDRIGDHGDRPPVVAADTLNVIILVGSRSRKEAPYKPCKSISKYDPLLDRWEKFSNKPTATYRSALLCNKGFLYCFGGLDQSGTQTNLVERMNLKTFEWCKVANMKKLHYGMSAAECKGNIYLLGPKQADTIGLEMYDPKTDQWTEKKTMDLISSNRLPSFHKAFDIDGSLMVVTAGKIVKYDVDSDEWCIVTTYRNKMFIEEAVSIYMSL